MLFMNCGCVVLFMYCELCSVVNGLWLRSAVYAFWFCSVYHVKCQILYSSSLTPATQPSKSFTTAVLPSNTTTQVFYNSSLTTATQPPKSFTTAVLPQQFNHQSPLLQQSCHSNALQQQPYPSKTPFPP